MTTTQKVSGGFLKFVTFLQVLLFLNNRSIVHFWGWCGVRKVSKNWLYFVDILNE